MNQVRLLHIDDEADIREVVAISLGLDPEFAVRGCASGEDGLAVAAEFRPDLILLDVMMPVMDGPATLERLRENPQTAAIPVVFMTARAQTRELDQLKSLGAIGVIPKPFDPMTLAASVRSHMREMEDTLAAVRSTFVRRANDDAVAIAHARSALRNETMSSGAMARIREIAHGLAGAAGIFGFGEISSAASTLEEAVITAVNAGCAPEGIERALNALLECIEKNNFCREERTSRRPDA